MKRRFTMNPVEHETQRTPPSLLRALDLGELLAPLPADRDQEVERQALVDRVGELELDLEDRDQEPHVEEQQEGLEEVVFEVEPETPGSAGLRLGLRGMDRASCGGRRGIRGPVSVPGLAAASPLLRAGRRGRRAPRRAPDGEGQPAVRRGFPAVGSMAGVNAAVTAVSASPRAAMIRNRKRCWHVENPTPGSGVSRTGSVRARAGRRRPREVIGRSGRRRPLAA